MALLAESRLRCIDRCVLDDGLVGDPLTEALARAVDPLRAVRETVGEKHAAAIWLRLDVADGHRDDGCALRGPFLLRRRGLLDVEVLGVTAAANPSAQLARSIGIRVPSRISWRYFGR